MSEYQSLFAKNMAGRSTTGSPSAMNQSQSIFTYLPYLYSLGLRQITTFTTLMACLVVGLTAIAGEHVLEFKGRPWQR